MKILTRARSGYLVTLAAGVAIGFTAVGTAVAMPSHQAHPAQPARSHAVTHHYTLAASAFAPDSLDNTADDYYNHWDFTELTNNGSGRCFDAGLSLPPNALLKKVTFYYTQGKSDGLYMEVNRQNLAGQTSRILVSARPAPNGTAPKYTHLTKTFNKKYATVNMTDFGYSAGVCPFGDASFSGLIITYTIG
jgi:hypothetical protein